MNESMQHPFVEGDLVRYVRDDGRVRVGFVVDPAKFSNTRFSTSGKIIRPENVWACWTDEHTPDWAVKRPTHASIDRVEAHPNPDALIADYTKWRLLNG
jgi:hypothetical protein